MRSDTYLQIGALWALVYLRMISSFLRVRMLSLTTLSIHLDLRKHKRVTDTSRERSADHLKERKDPEDLFKVQEIIALLEITQYILSFTQWFLLIILDLERWTLTKASK